MGSSTDAVIISNAKNLSIEATLKLFGCEQPTLNRSSQTHGNVFSRHGIIVGRNKDCLYLQGDFASTFFLNPTPSSQEIKISKALSQHDIIALTNYGTSNSYSFIVIEKGQRIRAKIGGHGEGIIIDEGAPLPEETETYEKVEEVDGVLKYTIVHNYTDRKTGQPVARAEQYTHDAIGGTMAHNLAKRILGKSLDETWTDGFDFFEYYPQKILEQRRPIKRANLTSKARINFQHYELILTKLFKESLKKILVPILEDKGFEYDERELKFTRTINGIIQSIHIASPNSIGHVVIKQIGAYLSLTHPFQKEWWLKEFNTLQWSPKNKKSLISDRIIYTSPFQSDQRKVNVKGHTNDLSHDEIVELIKSYILDTYLPFLESTRDLKQLARSIYSPIPKIEALFSQGLFEEAKYEISKLLKQSKAPSFTSTWIVDYLKQRIEKFYPTIAFEDFLDQEVKEPAPVFQLSADEIFIDLSPYQSIAKEAEPAKPKPKQALKTEQQAQASPDQKNWLNRLIKKLFGK